jgi:non-ribosomal peptide synthetase component F
VVVGSPYHGRDAAGTESLIGYFVNMLALRIEMLRVAGCSVDCACRVAINTAALSMRHASVPFQLMVHEVLPCLAHESSRNSVFQTTLAVGEHSEEARRVDSSNLTDTVPGQSASQAKFDVSLYLSQASCGQASGSLSFNTNLYMYSSVSRVATRLSVLVAVLVKAPAETNVLALPLMQANEAKWSLGRCSTTNAFLCTICVHDLVAIQSVHVPKAPSQEWLGVRMQYDELMVCVARAGSWLRTRGVLIDSMLALQLPRSMEQIVGVLGVLASGGAYLPLDPKWPFRRRLLIIRDSHSTTLVTHGEHAFLWRASVWEASFAFGHSHGYGDAAVG